MLSPLHALLSTSRGGNEEGFGFCVAQSPPGNGKTVVRLPFESAAGGATRVQGNELEATVCMAHCLLSHSSHGSWGTKADQNRNPDFMSFLLFLLTDISM